MGCAFPWLPLAKDALCRAEGVPYGLKQNIAGVCIVLADDLDDVVLTCQTLFDTHGAVVTGATGGEQAVQAPAALAQQAFDLPTSDISMPSMDGDVRLNPVRQLPRYANLPAIAVTGPARQSDIAHARQPSFNARVGKPMSGSRCQ